jgi:penicillin G amidase
LRLRVLAAAVAVAVAVPATGSTQTPPPAGVADHVHGGNVTPPGNNGHIPAPQLAAALAGSYQAPNSTDQRDLYVDWERKDWSFATEGDADLGAPLSPAGRTDVRIYKDKWGVPRIFADSDEAAQFGVGYAMATQRLFQADVFRRVARGEMSSFLGGQEWYDYDREWRKTFYTDEELVAMFTSTYTAEEQALVQAYIDGINAYIAEARRDPSKMPAEYVALGQQPEDWELRHSLSIFVLQARDSVEGFGQELDNAALLHELEERLGRKQGRKAFRDIRFVRDPGTYTTAPASPRAFPYPGGGFAGLNARGVALPDSAEQAEQVAAREELVRGALQRVGLHRKQASNAITVAPKASADGRPILLGGPQLEYLAPGIFWEFEVHGATQHARGIGFAGTAGIVLIGKSPTHAWSITYGYTDQVDTFLVPLDPSKPDTHYLRDGESRELQTYTSTVQCKADQTGAAGSPEPEDTCDGQPAAQTEIRVQRVPEYGPVVGRVTVKGQPHAVVRVAAHWMREIANGKPFIELNRASTIQRIRAAQRDFTVSLNLNYIDNQGNAGFWHVARPPIRAKGTDVRLPTLGTGRYDWTGIVPLRDIPHAINPSQGFTANWNNQVGKGWHNGDSNSWADVQRVDMLARRMRSLSVRGDITARDLWRVNRQAAFEDARVFESRPLLNRAWSGRRPGNPKVAEALNLVRGWNAQRTSTQDDDGTWRYDAAAVRIWDRFFATLQRRILRDELGEARYDELIADLEVDFYYLAWPLTQRILKGNAAPLRAKHDWLDGVPAQRVVRRAFAKAVRQLDAELGGDPSTWKGEAAMTTYRAVGLGSVEPHPFMNRGTYNQLATVDVVD